MYRGQSSPQLARWQVLHRGPLPEGNELVWRQGTPWLQPGGASGAAVLRPSFEKGANDVR